MSEKIVAAIQTNANDDINHNLKVAETLLIQAKDQGAVVAVLPECFALMQSSRKQLLDCAESPGTGTIQDFLREISSRLGLWIIAGSIPIRSDDPGKVFNTLMVYDQDGSHIARYDKIFLFDVELSETERYFESDYTAAGREICVLKSPIGSIGLSICYDLRFPELYRRLAELGAEIVVVPSAFSVTTGPLHWRTLLSARAIENSCYVVAPAQFGNHNGKRTTWGHSLIVDPWGETLAELDSGEGVIIAEIEPQILKDVRKKLPSLEHRRSDLL